MVRNVLAMVRFIGPWLGGLGVWQFGFFSAKVAEVTTKIERETAVARAQGMIQQTRRRADELLGKSRELRIEARRRELQAERDTEKLDTTRKESKPSPPRPAQADSPSPAPPGPMMGPRRSTSPGGPSRARRSTRRWSAGRWSGNAASASRS